MRYILLVVLNMPLILMALINSITQYKMKKISAKRFRHQITLWIVILLLLVGSFPLYNLLQDKAMLESSSLSLVDVLQSTAIVYLLYAINNQRRKIESNEKLFRELHQELSIKLSKDNGKS